MNKELKLKVFNRLVGALKENIDNWVEWSGDASDTFSEFESFVRGTEVIQFEGVVDIIPQDIKDECMNNDCTVSGVLKEILESALCAVRYYWKWGE